MESIPELLSGERRDWIAGLIRDYCAVPANTLQDAMNEPAWGAPLVGFARGDDPLWQEYKEYVGPYHWTPAEILAITFPGATFDPADLTVICWILPQTERTKADNRLETTFPSERWARSRIFGETFNSLLREHVADTLCELGCEAVAPHLSPAWSRRDSERYVFSSTWSERHVAYAAGLGTFGLCDGLITRAGKAMRVGSVVTRLVVPPTPRPYTDHRAYCSFFADGSCGECIGRCPAGAITQAGHDKLKCSAHVSSTAAFVREHYGFEGYGCGLCQTGVPCESGIPVAKWAQS